ncbi:MAG: GTP-binding protein [Thaumarchaeota archaeon]|nr:GTP-binding protein [Nitrososphaerota archaeon]
MKTPVSILTGYLGSGKTTLLRRILNETTKKVAVIINEFGDIGIDGRVIKGKNVNMIELTGGCVCCSLEGEFKAAIKEIITKTNPELILVETTGVAEPEAIAFDLEESLPEVRLDSVITVVDADGIMMFPSIGHTGRVQIEMGDVILVNKIDLVNPRDIIKVEKKLHEINGKATLFRTYKCEIDSELLFGTYTTKTTEQMHKHEHDPKIDLFQISVDQEIQREGLSDFLSSLPREVYRAKGLIVIKNHGLHLLNYVVGRWDLEPMPGNYSSGNQLVFIGERVGSKKKVITEKLNEVLMRK